MFSTRKKTILENSERLAERRQKYLRRAAFFHEEDLRYLRFLIPEGLRVLEIGCATGDVLANLKPNYGLGVDISPAMINEAKKQYPHLEFQVGDVEDEDFVASLPGPFDVILIVDTIGALDDCQKALELVNQLCTHGTRLIIAYYSHLWDPLVKFAELIGWRSRQPLQNILSPADVRLVGELAGYEVI